MHRWFTVHEQDALDGTRHSVDVQSLDGRHADEIPDFVEQLVHHVLGYALHANIDLDNQFNARYRIPTLNRRLLTRRSIDQLLYRSGPAEPYLKLMGFVGECLAHWIYDSFTPPVALSAPKANSLDPAYDLLALFDKDGELQTTCVQAKTTGNDASTQCRAAVEKYGSLHEGMYDFQLASELHLLAQIPGARELLAGRDWHPILLDPERRDYVIFVAYSGPPPDGPRSVWPHTWAATIPGPPERRTLIRLPMLNFNGFIDEIARRIDATAP